MDHGENAGLQGRASYALTVSSFTEEKGQVWTLQESSSYNSGPSKTSQGPRTLPQTQVWPLAGSGDGGSGSKLIILLRCRGCRGLQQPWRGWGSWRPSPVPHPRRPSRLEHLDTERALEHSSTLQLLPSEAGLLPFPKLATPRLIPRSGSPQSLLECSTRMWLQNLHFVQPQGFMGRAKSFYQV